MSSLVLTKFIAMLYDVIHNDVNDGRKPIRGLYNEQRTLEEEERIKFILDKLEIVKKQISNNEYSPEKKLKLFRSFSRFPYMSEYCEKVLILIKFENNFIIENQVLIIRDIISPLILKSQEQNKQQKQSKIDFICETVLKNQLSLITIKEEFYFHLIHETESEDAYQIFRLLLMRGIKVGEDIDQTPHYGSLLKIYLIRQSRIHNVAFSILSYYYCEKIRRQSRLSKLGLLPEHIIRDLIMFYF